MANAEDLTSRAYQEALRRYNPENSESLANLLTDLAVIATTVRSREGEKKSIVRILTSILPTILQKGSLRASVNTTGFLSRLYTQAGLLAEGSLTSREAVQTKYFEQTLVSSQEKLYRDPLFSNDSELRNTRTGKELGDWFARNSRPEIPILLLEDDELINHVRDCLNNPRNTNMPDVLIADMNYETGNHPERLLEDPKKLRKIIAVAIRVNDVGFDRSSLFFRDSSKVDAEVERLLKLPQRSKQEQEKLEKFVHAMKKSDLVVATLASEICGWREYSNLNLDQRYAEKAGTIQGVTFADNVTFLKELKNDVEVRRMLKKTRDRGNIARETARAYLQTEMQAKRTFSYAEINPTLAQPLQELLPQETQVRTSVSRTVDLEIDTEGIIHNTDRIRISDKVCVTWKDDQDRQYYRVFSQADFLQPDSPLNTTTTSLEDQNDLDIHSRIFASLAQHNYNVPMTLQDLRRQNLGITDQKLREYIEDVISSAQFHIIGGKDQDRITSSSIAGQYANNVINLEKKKNPHSPAMYAVFDNRWQMCLAGAFNHVIEDGVARSNEISAIMTQLASNLEFEEQSGFFHAHNNIDFSNTSPTIAQIKNMEKYRKMERNHIVEGFTKIHHLYNICLEISERVRTISDGKSTALKSPSMIFQLLVASFYNEAYAKIHADTSIAKKPLGVLFNNTDISKQLDLYPIEQAFDLTTYLALVEAGDHRQVNMYLRSMIEKTEEALDNSSMELVNKTKRAVPRAEVRRALNAIANAMKEGTGELSGETMFSCLPFPKSWDSAKKMPRRLRSPKPAKSDNQKVCCTMGFAGLYQKDEISLEELIVSINVKSEDNVESVLMVEALRAAIQYLEAMAKKHAKTMVEKAKK